MISPDEYPVYNHRERPGIGRNTAGETYFNCFSIRLERNHEANLLPYTFRNFLVQYEAYADYSGTCESCISHHKALTFSVDGVCCDLSAVDRKFYPEDVNEADYHYCPLVQQILEASGLGAESVGPRTEGLPARPISAILAANWDDNYLFPFKTIGAPRQAEMCLVLQRLLTNDFVATPAERSFLAMWFVAAFHLMEAVRSSGQSVYLEPQDFIQGRSKLFDFVLPVPQVWVTVIPKPAPGRDRNEWEQIQGAYSQPQRVDFLLVQGGRRHVIEVDDIGHYATRSTTGDWQASEKRYGQTLLHSRLLRACGFEVHRFTNQEMLTLSGVAGSTEPDLAGFIDLLRSEGLYLEGMVFAHQAQ